MICNKLHENTIVYKRIVKIFFINIENFYIFTRNKKFINMSQMTKESIDEITRIAKVGSKIKISEKILLLTVASKCCSSNCYFFKNEGCDNCNCEAESRFHKDNVIFTRI